MIPDNNQPFISPLFDDEISGNLASPCIMVIFGASGDLTGRKLLPALYNLARDGQLPPHFACVGFARRPKSHGQFRLEMKEAINKYSRVKPVDETLWNAFGGQVFYHQSEFHDDEGYKSLKIFLEDLDRQYDTKGNRVFYLSTQPVFFPLIVKKLKEHSLIYSVQEEKKHWSRVIIEKPFGDDLQSAIALQENLSQSLDESQIYRIDHYLGKETVQNLFALRFSNPIFESMWNHQYIDNIQITVAEDIGIETRGNFWEATGMMRDIVQNHVMQLLSLVAMEPPFEFSASHIHDEKVKALEAIRPIDPNEIDAFAVRGQYGPGYIEGMPVKGYREEKDVSPTSNADTFVALELYIDNPRWNGVPFYLRSGKRLPKKATEITINFKSNSDCLLWKTFKGTQANCLIIRIQPDEGVSLKMNCKVPGINKANQPVKMNFKYGAYFGLTPPEAYERLLCDCMAGDSTLFARGDEVISSWKLLTPILKYWEKTKAEFPNYASGTWGPKESDALLKKTNRSWRLI